MFFSIQLLISCLAIILLFISDFNAQVTTSLFLFFVTLFILKHVQHKLKFLLKTLALTLFFGFGYMYFHNPDGTSIVKDGWQSIRTQEWGLAKENVKKIFLGCQPCVKNAEKYLSSFSHKSLKSSYQEKSKNFKQMVTAIQKHHRDIPEDQIPKALIKKSTEEFKQLKVRFENAQGRAADIRALASQQEDYSVNSEIFKKLESNSPNLPKYEFEFFQDPETTP